MYLHFDGSKYTGDWENDEQNGKGEENFVDGSIFVGYYSYGKKHGFGEF